MPMDYSVGAKLLTIKDVCEIVRVSRSSVYDFLNQRSPRYKPDFPRPVRIGSGARGCVRWRLAEVEAWVASLQAG